MKRSLKIMMLWCVAMTALPARAAEDATPSSGPVRAGWYVAPMLTYMQPDGGRCGVDSDYGLAAAFGHRGEFASIELWGQFLVLPHGGCTYTVPAPTPTDPEARETVNEPAGEVELHGGGLDLVLGPFFDDAVLGRFFGIVGFGVLRREGHPQYRQGDTTIFGDGGLGYLQPFALFGLDLLARLEARYRYDVQQPPHPEDQEPAPKHAYGDVIVNLGLQIPLSAKPEAALAAAAEPVSVVAVADADGDGVADGNDTCPDTAPGATTDATGCVPAPLPPAEVSLETAQAGDTIVLHGVNFETARSTLTTNAQTILDQIAEKLVARPGLKVEIGGHTDSRGADNYNQLLSEQRAQSVLTYLADKGVAAAALSAVGYGEARPTDSNDTDEGRERNRRVELKVLESHNAHQETPQ